MVTFQESAYPFSLPTPEYLSEANTIKRRLCPVGKNCVECVCNEKNVEPNILEE
jgi:hypothetical protein